MDNTYFLVDVLENPESLRWRVAHNSDGGDAVDGKFESLGAYMMAEVLNTGKFLMASKRSFRSATFLLSDS